MKQQADLVAIHEDDPSTGWVNVQGLAGKFAESALRGDLFQVGDTILNKYSYPYEITAIEEFPKTRRITLAFLDYGDNPRTGQRTINRARYYPAHHDAIKRHRPYK